MANLPVDLPSSGRQAMSSPIQLAKSTPSLFLSSLPVKMPRKHSKHGHEVATSPPGTKNRHKGNPSISASRSCATLAGNLSHVPCKFFKQGTCTAGANCIFSHDRERSSAAAMCKYYLKGNCKFGTKCALLHTLSPLSDRGNSWLQFISVGSPQEDYDGDIDYDVNDVMLPSSLNDLLTPSELQKRKERETLDLLTTQGCRDESMSSSYTDSFLIMQSPPSRPTGPGLDMAPSLSSSWTPAMATSFPPSRMGQVNGLPLFLPDDNEPFVMDDDGPFAMDDVEGIREQSPPILPKLGRNTTTCMFPSLVGNR